MRNQNQKLFSLKIASSVVGVAFLLLCAVAARILSEAGAAVPPSPAVVSGSAVIGSAHASATIINTASAPGLPAGLYAGLAVLLLLLAVLQIGIRRIKKQDEGQE